MATAFVGLLKGKVVTSVLLLALMTESLLLGPLSVTYARKPAGVLPIATLSGWPPRVTVATTVLLVVLITLTSPVPNVATYTRSPSGVMATPDGSRPVGDPTGPVGTVVSTVFVPVLMTETLCEPRFVT